MTKQKQELINDNDVTTFSGVIQYRFLQGPFFADLVITDDHIDLNPRGIPFFDELEQRNLMSEGFLLVEQHHEVFDSRAALEQSTDSSLFRFLAPIAEGS